MFLCFFYKYLCTKKICALIFLVSLFSNKVFCSESPSNIWNAYLNSLPTNIQVPCFPFYLSPKSENSDGVTTKKPKGTIILFHSFSTCPQQFIDLSLILARNGFEVYAPLIEGHGRLPIHEGRLEDNLNDLPSISEFDHSPKYDTFIHKMSELVYSISARNKRIGIETHLGGVSLGSLIALNVFLENRHTIQSLLLVSPFLRPASFLGRMFTGTNPAQFKTFKNILEMEFNLDNRCEEVERRQGRGGYCKVKLGQMLAVQNLAVKTLQKLEGIRHIKNTKIQVVGVDKDPVVYNESVYHLYTTLRLKTENIGACKYHSSANHSLFSKFDSPWEIKYWLNSVYHQTLLFFAEGKLFETVNTFHETPLENKMPFCFTAFL